MNILKMINLKSFLKYKICIIIIFFALMQSSLNNMDNKIEAKEPEFVYNNPKGL